MKKEDFYGKYIIGGPYLKPIKLTKEVCDRLLEESLETLYCDGLLFDSFEKACIAADNAAKLIRSVNDGTYLRESDIAPVEPRKKRIYISGPISGHDTEECRKRFKEVEIRLIEQGYRVFNPLKNGLPFNADTHQHMRRDLNVLTNEEDSFDYIYMMKRWPHSSGCKTELDNAIACGISIMWEESGEITKFE